MTQGVSIEWCPSCEAWGKSTRGAIDVLIGNASSSGIGTASIGEFVFDYCRVLHQCDACGNDFVTTSVAKCDTKYHWHANAEINRLGKLPEERSFGVRALA